MTKIEIEINYEPFEKGLLGLTFSGRYDKQEVCGGICMLAPQVDRKVIVEESGEIRTIGLDDSAKAEEG